MRVPDLIVACVVVMCTALAYGAKPTKTERVTVTAAEIEAKQYPPHHSLDRSLQLLDKVAERKWTGMATNADNSEMHGNLLGTFALRVSPDSEEKAKSELEKRWAEYKKKSAFTTQTITGKLLLCRDWRVVILTPSGKYTFIASTLDKDSIEYVDKSVAAVHAAAEARHKAVIDKGNKIQYYGKQQP